MTAQVNNLPKIPSTIPVESLQPNLKLYSEADIAEIKSDYPANGFYPENIDLTHPVLVSEGRYFALYTDNSKNSYAQDLDTGEWVDVSVVSINEKNADITRDDIVHEVMSLHANHQTIVSGAANEPVTFFCSAEDGVEEHGVYYFLTKQARGLSLEQWLKQAPELTPVTKMDISQRLVDALMTAHAKELLHADLRLKHVMYDIHANEIALTNYGFLTWPEWTGKTYLAPEIRNAEGQGSYTVKSDIYSLGLALGKLWGLVEHHHDSIKNTVGVTFQSLIDGEALLKENVKLSCAPGVQEELVKLITAMIAEDPAERPEMDEVRETLARTAGMLSELDREVFVVVLDIEEFETVRKDAARYEEWMRNLRDNNDVIRFADLSGAASVTQLILAKQEFRKQGLVVDDAYYVGSSQDIEALFEEKAEFGRINHCVLVTTPKEEVIKTATDEVPALKTDVNDEAVIIPAATGEVPTAVDVLSAMMAGEIPERITMEDDEQEDPLTWCASVASSCFSMFWSGPSEETCDRLASVNLLDQSYDSFGVFGPSPCLSFEEEEKEQTQSQIARYI